MSDAKAIRERLHALRHAFDADEIDAVCAEIERSRIGLAVVPDLFAIMEAHPDEDLGTPGEIVHTIEHFHREGYEQHLLDSLRRKPVAHTVWMLNWLVDGAAAAKARLPVATKADKSDTKCGCLPIKGMDSIHENLSVPADWQGISLSPDPNVSQAFARKSIAGLRRRYKNRAREGRKMG